MEETRHLVLPLQTVLDAVVHLDRRNHGSLPNGEAMQAEFVRGAPPGHRRAVKGNVPTTERRR